MSTKIIVITAAAVLVVVLGVVMIVRPSVNVTVPTDAIADALREVSFGGVSNFDELGSNNVGVGYVRLVSTSTSQAADNTSNRMGWLNDTIVNGEQKSVIVRQSDISFVFTPQGASSTNNGRSTSTAYVVLMATSSSVTSEANISSFEGLRPNVKALANFYIASSSEATTTNPAFLRTVNLFSEAASSTPVLRSGQEIASTSIKTVPEILVRYGEALQVVILPAHDANNCGSQFLGANTGNGGLQNCTAATSSDRGFQLEVFFKYLFNDQTQPQP